MILPDRPTLWLVGPIFLALLPHALYVPAWASLAVALALLWRLGPAWRKDSGWQRGARGLLAGAGLLATFLQFRTLAGPEAGITLLVMMVALKLLESDGRRDHMIAVLAGYFSLMAVLIHHQQLLAAAWLLLAAAVLTASLRVNQASAATPLWPALRLGATLVLQALPLAVLLFLLFPRLPSPMTGLVHTQAAQTGLSDRMEPGSVSQLIRSDTVAFRVDFADPATDGRKLYWRGPVLPDFDGRVWRRAETAEAPQTDRTAAPLRYTVTLETSRQPWLPVAGLVADPPVAGARLTADLEWLTARPGHDRLRYGVQAWTDYRLEATLAEFRRAQALGLPDRSNPEAVRLGRLWADENPDPAARVQRALAHFRSEPFHYTLNPPALGEHAVDDFLFLTRRGFCEHYAGAFTVLMRAAGVPARVVTGFQGGERNPVGGYWVVRNRDAHAWAEVWLEGRGWVRVDPTAAIAPERVELGLDAALPAGERPLLNLPPDWLQPLRQGWDFINNGWNQWVLGYDFQRQKRLLSSLSPSLATMKGMLWTMLAGAGLVLGLLAWSLFRDAGRPPDDPAARQYARFLARLAAVGLSRLPGEGPVDFASRAARDRPDLARPIRQITTLYVGLRYGRTPAGEIDALRRAVGTFRPPRERKKAL